MRLPALILLALAAPAAAQTVTNATARATHGPDARIVATITSPVPDAIGHDGSSSPAADALRPHLATRHGMKMAAITLAPGKARRLSVHGYHLMLLGLKQPLVAGQTYPMTIHFARSGKDVVTSFSVVP